MALLGDRNKNKPSILGFWSCYLCLILNDYLYLFQQLGLVIFFLFDFVVEILGKVFKFSSVSLWQSKTS